MDLFIQRDGSQYVREALREALQMIAPTVKVRAQLGEWERHDAPVVVVTSDSSQSAGIATTSETIRIAVYASHQPTARKICTFLDAFILDPARTAGFKFSPGQGLICALDPDTGGWVASVSTVAQSVKKEARYA